MSISFSRVGPGDVISSALVNRLLEEIEKLDDRLTVIEQGGPAVGGVPLVTGRIPTGDVAVASQLTLSGADFLIPPQLNTVTIGGASVTQFFASSTDRTLIMRVPNVIPGVTLPAFLPVQVHNRNGDSNTLTVRVVPAGVVPQGGCSITAQPAVTGVIEVGGTYTFRYLVDSATDIPETYLLSMLFLDLDGASEASWQAGARVLPIGPQLISRGSPLAVAATFTVPAGAARARIALKAQSVHNDADLTTTSSPILVATGAVPEISDARINIVPADIGPAAQNSRRAVIDGQEGLEIRFEQTATVRFNARFVEAGTYRFAAEIAEAGALWNLGPVSPTDPTPQPAAGFERISFQLTLTAKAPAAGEPPAGEQRLLTVRVFRRDDAGTTDVWQSFRTIPIRGFN